MNKKDKAIVVLSHTTIYLALLLLYREFVVPDLPEQLNLGYSAFVIGALFFLFYAIMYLCLCIWSIGECLRRN